MFGAGLRPRRSTDRRSPRLPPGTFETGRKIAGDLRSESRRGRRPAPNVGVRDPRQTWRYSTKTSDDDDAFAGRMSTSSSSQSGRSATGRRLSSISIPLIHASPSESGTAVSSTLHASDERSRATIELATDNRCCTCSGMSSGIDTENSRSGSAGAGAVTGKTPTLGGGADRPDPGNGSDRSSRDGSAEERASVGTAVGRTVRGGAAGPAPDGRTVGGGAVGPAPGGRTAGGRAAGPAPSGRTLGGGVAGPAPGDGDGLAAPGGRDGPADGGPTGPVRGPGGPDGPCCAAGGLE